MSLREKLKKRRFRPPTISSETVERRTVVEWLGKATVLAIGADLVSACSTFTGTGLDGDADSRETDPDTGTGTDIDTETDIDTDTWPDASVPDVCDGPDDFDFAPGPRLHSVFEDWGERTVDPQDLVQILSSWDLTIDGMVDNPTTLSFADLLGLDRRDQTTDFHCVEGWSIYEIPWNGVSFETLLNLVSPRPEASHMTFHSLGDVYRDSIPLEVAAEPKTLLAYGIDCSTLPLKHGFPLRVVIPRKWAYKGPKFVHRVELTDEPVTGFWEQFGYPYDGDVPESRLREGYY